MLAAVCKFDAIDFTRKSILVLAGGPFQPWFGGHSVSILEMSELPFLISSRMEVKLSYGRHISSGVLMSDLLLNAQ